MSSPQTTRDETDPRSRGRGCDPLARPLSRHDPREPGRRRPRVAAGREAGARRARQGRGHVPGRRGAAAARVLVDAARRPAPLAARRRRQRACCSRSTARTRAGSGPIPRCSHSAPLVVNVDHHHDNSRFGAVNLVVADASSTGEIVRDLLRRARRRADARDRGGALHRARHRHGTLPVHEHDAEGAAPRRGARRGRRGRAQDLPGRLRERPVREAEAARPRARAGARSTRAAGS